MTPTEIPTFVDRMGKLAETLHGGRSLTPGAMETWVTLLKPFAFPDVSVVLDDWLRSQSRMPAPADLVRKLEAMRTDKRERDEPIEAARDGAMIVRQLASNPGIRMSLEELFASTNPRNPRQGGDHKAWARAIVACHEAGRNWPSSRWYVEGGELVQRDTSAPVTSAQLAIAREALGLNVVLEEEAA